jgi:hypothetical protein
MGASFDREALGSRSWVIDRRTEPKAPKGPRDGLLGEEVEREVAFLLGPKGKNCYQSYGGWPRERTRPSNSKSVTDSLHLIKRSKLADSTSQEYKVPPQEKYYAFTRKIRQ